MPLTHTDASFGTQLVGIVAIESFVIVIVIVIITSSLTWLVLKSTVGIRADAEDEAMGQDKAELGLEAYPEFGRGA